MDIREQDRLDQSKDERSDGSQSHGSPAALDDLLVGQSPSKIPNQVADAVEAVEGEGESNNVLGEELSSHGQGTEGSSDRSGLKVPSQQRSDKVSGSESVETARENGTGDTVGGRQIPGDLRAVDREMRGDRTVETLLGQQLGGISVTRRRGRRSIFQSETLNCIPQGKRAQDSYQ